MALRDIKREVINKINSIQVLVNKYPVLLKNKFEDLTSFTFLFNILKKLGISEDEITEWICKIVSDGGKTGEGIINIIEKGIRGVILADLNQTFTCQLNPSIPNGITYFYQGGKRLAQQGVAINVNDLDIFGILNFCPTTKDGSIYYFDTNKDNGYTPSNVYSSTDFNAYLWYIINSASNDITNSENVWDNRLTYRRNFLNNQNVITGSTTSEVTAGDRFKKAFFSEKGLNNKPVNLIDKPDGGWPKIMKAQLLSCRYDESVGSKGGVIKVFLNGDRYTRNKTIADFNADYMSSIKLFDSKTILAAAINGVAGIASNIRAKLPMGSFLNIELISDIVEQSINEVEEEKKIDCYFSFSDEKYDTLYRRAMAKYNSSQNLSADNASDEDIIANLTAIENAGTEEEEVAIINKTIRSAIGNESSINLNFKQISFDNIEKFVKELIKQSILYSLSPKTMLIYAINNALYEKDTTKPFSLDMTLNGMLNTITNITKQITEILLNAIGDIIISYVTDLLKLWAEKLLKESMDYYIMLLRDLLDRSKETYESAVDIAKSTSENLRSLATQGAKILNAVSGQIASVYGADIANVENNSPNAC